MKATNIDIGGRRVVRVGIYEIDVDGEDPESRIMIASGWQDDAAIPVSGQCITLPASALPALIEALRELGAES